MRTITYYSYKGGVGRSLLVANAAKYLSTLGKSVFALDLDLEAPGLHYKFELGSDTKRTSDAAGIIDILVKFLKEQSLPDSLEDFVTEIPVADGAGQIRVMRAGTAPSGDYWRLLSQVNWYDIFYGVDPVGVPFFLELKERIRRQFTPDFLLIDARTGITEMGGIATTLLPDSVVCVALASMEHLEGIRAVMHGIRNTTAREGTAVTLLPVISRLSQRRDEEAELGAVLSFLNEPLKPGAPSLGLEELMTLHSEPLLEAGEQLLVGGKNSPHDLPLLRDYLRLFSKIIPAEDIRPHVGQLIARAVGRLLDDPDAAQSELEALTTYCADQDAYKALLKLYQVRKVPIEKTVAAASLMWQFGGSRTSPDQLLVDIVRYSFSDIRPGDYQKKYAEFAEAIWRSGDMKEARIALTIVNAYLPERRDRAFQLLLDYIDKVSAPQEVLIVRLLELCRTGGAPKMAFDIIERFKAQLQSADFYATWARLTVDQKEPELVIRLINDPHFRQDTVQASEPVVMYRLYKLIGHEAAAEVLFDAVDKAASLEDIPQLRSIAEAIHDEGRLQELEIRLVGRIPPHVVEDIMDYARRRGGRRVRVPPRYPSF